MFDAKQVVERAAMLAEWCDSIDDTMRSRIETQFIERIRSIVMHREYYQDPVTPADLFETK